MRPEPERGAIAVLTVGLFLVLLLFLSMAVDLGIVFRYRRAMQNACDSGALAGALNLRRDPATAAPTAERYAASDMIRNHISWDVLQATTLDDNNQPTLIDPRRVRVEIREAVPTYFFRLLRPSIEVAVRCTARLTPIILTKGLVPIGLNWEAYATQLECNEYLWMELDDPRRPEQCRRFPLTFDISDNPNDPSDDSPWGSGNTGLLSMGCFDCPSGGGAQWLDYFINGSPTEYCYDMGRTDDVTRGTYPDSAPALCANVKTETGVKIGPITRGVDTRCESPNLLDRIIMVPLLNPAYQVSGQGTYTTEIWGFAAFQLDCSTGKFTGANPTIEGGFVSIVSMQAYGRETEFDTGVYTVKLIE
ncbi:MAG: Tad domain-containing protein [Armatimonadota bacterium]|nr:Tad domain-containing protein [Armatimonadota bacterium]